ncbi:hypothetical protein CA951_31225 [Rhodococcus sp. NCIMB 12038]|nr:hypothetical protein CA951_31225 [Rhodococcus sp. NCIMB 12038]
MLWKPRPGTSSIPEDFIEARATFRAIAAEIHWNPWVRDDRANEWEQALQIMGEWQRAEPGHRQLTEAECEARWKHDDEDVRQKLDARRQRFERERSHYDPDRAQSRLHLIELQSCLQHEQAELSGLRDKASSPAIPTGRSAERIAALENEVGEIEGQIAMLEATVGDPETVVDAHGRLPRDRREITLCLYSIHRTTRVRELRAQLADLSANLKAAQDKSRRIECRQLLADATGELEALLAIPRLAVDDMCSECATPAADHGWVARQTAGPCPAWPGWAAKMEKVRTIIERAAQRERPVTEPAQASQPLAIIASGLPITDVIARLEELRQEFPDAEVRRGRANRWELWPRKKHQPDTAT